MESCRVATGHRPVNSALVRGRPGAPSGYSIGPRFDENDGSFFVEVWKSGDYVRIGIQASGNSERLRWLRCAYAYAIDPATGMAVCPQFGISSKTGYKIVERYMECGLAAALNDRSRRPVRYANELPPQVESLVAAALAEHCLSCSATFLAMSRSGAKPFQHSATEA